MNRGFCFFLFSFLFLASVFTTKPVFSEPKNLSKLKSELVRYVDEGAYYQSLAQVYHRAQYYLGERILQHKAQKATRSLAVVLDIDETVLSNYAHIKANDFVGNKEAIVRGIMQGDSTPILPAIDFIKYAQSQGVAVFFVTGRGTSLNTVTENNLRKAGIDHWQGLYSRPDNCHPKSIRSFKSKIRAKIAANNFIIVESIGDQWSDIYGGYAEKGFKLTNPFYFVP